MASAKPARTISGSRYPDGRSTGRSRRAVESLRLYGWDSRTETWHGPDELSCRSLPDNRLLRALGSVAGRSWYGPVKCSAPGEPATRFFALVHDLADCAVASIYCDESKAGPAEVLTVIPAGRRLHLRDEFAFEFLGFAAFLG